MEQEKKIISYNEEQTKKLGSNLAKLSSDGEVIGLIGDLGGGKTTFVQGFAQSLGIKEPITSPSFVLMKKYPISNLKSSILLPTSRDAEDEQISNLYHIDLYRIKDLSDVYSFGFYEILEDKKSIILIEWAEKVMRILPKQKLIIEFDFLGENERKIIFKPIGKRYEELINKLKFKMKK